LYQNLFETMGCDDHAKGAFVFGVETDLGG
jgi:hypothetical protein